MAQAELAPGRLAHQRESLGHELIECRSGGEPCLQCLSPAGKFTVGERGDAGLEAIDGRNRTGELLDQSLITAAENLS